MSVSYEPSEHESIAFTIKKLKDPKSAVQSEYEAILNIWQKHFSVYVECHNYEIDNEGILHVHGILVLKRNYYLKRLKVKNYHVYLKDIYSKEEWLDYINKDVSDVNNQQYMF